MGAETLLLSGADANLFEIVGAELFLKANTALDFESLNQLNVTIEVDDASIGTGFEDSTDFTLSIADVNEAPTVSLVNRLLSISENTAAQTKVADIIVTDDALGSENLILSGAEADLFEIIGTLSYSYGQTLESISNPMQNWTLRSLWMIRRSEAPSKTLTAMS